MIALLWAGDPALLECGGARSPLRVPVSALPPLSTQCTPSAPFVLDCEGAHSAVGDPPPSPPPPPGGGGGGGGGPPARTSARAHERTHASTRARTHAAFARGGGRLISVVVLYKQRRTLTAATLLAGRRRAHRTLFSSDSHALGARGRTVRGGGTPAGRTDDLRPSAFVCGVGGLCVLRGRRPISSRQWPMLFRP